MSGIDNFIYNIGASVSYSTNVYTPRRYSQQQANTEEMPTVDYEYVKKVTTSKDVLIIDVREPDEVKEHGKIPNSVNIPRKCFIFTREDLGIEDRYHPQEIN